MNSASQLYQFDITSREFLELRPRSASSLKVKEKAIEEWMVRDPGLLFSERDAVLIIAQEVAGEVMADLLAVDSQGNLIIVEIKRDWSDRTTVGQILDYAAILSGWTYEDFNSRWKKFKNDDNTDLFDEFVHFVENEDFDRRQFLENKRLFILAGVEDESMKRIISWLRDKYKVPIDFVPFQLYEGGEQLFLEIHKIDIEPMPSDEQWTGDWFFNTNESYGKGAYRAMFEHSVIATYGYGNDFEILSRPAQGQRVFAYVNGHGIAGVGRFSSEPPVPGNDVFGKEAESEHHRKVEWEVILDLDKAIPAADVSRWGYNLPVRSTLCHINHSRVADKIARRASERASQLA